MRHLDAELHLKKRLDSIDDLVQSIWSTISDPKDLSIGLCILSGQQEGLTSIIDIGYGPVVCPGASKRCAAVLDHGEKKGLTRRLSRAVKPAGPQDHSFDMAPPEGIVQHEFHFHLGVAI